MKMGVLSAVIVVAITVSAVQSSAQSDCDSVILGLSPCLNYIQGNATAPSAGCCTQLANIIKTQPKCLCQVVSGGGSSVGVSVNRTLALVLPKACNVNTPSISLCNATSPSGSPLSPSSGGGSSAAPPHGGDSSDGFSVRLKMPFSAKFITCLSAIALYAATIFSAI